MAVTALLSRERGCRPGRGRTALGVACAYRRASARVKESWDAESASQPKPRRTHEVFHKLRRCFRAPQDPRPKMTLSGYAGVVSSDLQVAFTPRNRPPTVVSSTASNLLVCKLTTERVTECDDTAPRRGRRRRSRRDRLPID